MQDFIHFFTHIYDNRETVSDFILVLPFLNAVNDDLFDYDYQINNFLRDTFGVFLSDGADESNDIVFSLVVVYFFQVKFKHVHAPNLNIVVFEQLINYCYDFIWVFFLNLYQLR